MGDDGGNKGDIKEEKEGRKRRKNGGERGKKLED